MDNRREPRASKKTKKEAKNMEKTIYNANARQAQQDFWVVFKSISVGVQ